MLERARMRYTAFIGLGSNLASVAGTPTETVLAAVQALSAAGGVVAQSSLYRTAPVGYREQPYFINAVACIETGLEPEDFCGSCWQSNAASDGSGVKACRKDRARWTWISCWFLVQKG